jgi:hypothetical protein
VRKALYFPPQNNFLCWLTCGESTVLFHRTIFFVSYYYIIKRTVANCSLENIWLTKSTSSYLCIKCFENLHCFFFVFCDWVFSSYLQYERILLAQARSWWCIKCFDNLPLFFLFLALFVAFSSGFNCFLATSLIGVCSFFLF